MVMDIESLIALIFTKPPLWDKRSKFHSNRHIVDKCWKEISKELNEDEIKLRKKWKYLRDQFSVELGKMPPYRCDEAAIAYEPKWPYFQSLQFLKGVVTPRLNGNFPRANPPYPQPGTSAQDGQATDSSSSELQRVTPSPTSLEDDECDRKFGGNETQQTNPYSPPTIEKCRKRMRNEKLKYWAKKSKKQKLLENEDDEHLHFFRSILPHVRKIHNQIILSFRSRIQEVVEEFAYRSTLSFASPPSSMSIQYPNLTEPTVQDSIQNHI